MPKIKLFCILLIIILISPTKSKDVHYELLIKTVPGNPDGFPRPVIGVYDHKKLNMTDGRFLPEDRPFPGPLLRATIGDILHLKVHNMFDSDTTSIHFHGLHMKNNPWMDGVADVTQCGISPGKSFEYVFDLTQSGTFWYHSHTSTQYSDGLVGPIVIDPIEDLLLKEWSYTKEHILMLQDWFHEPSDNIITLYNGPRNIFKHFSPQYPWPTVSLLINGKGLFNCSTVDNWNYTLCNYDDVNPCDFDRKQCIPLRPPFYGNCHSVQDENPPFGVDKFSCDANHNARLRFINAAGNSPLRIWIDRHNLTIVARDGIDTKPSSVEYLTIPVGQRIDVIVNCDQDPKFDYYIFVTVATGFLPRGSVVPKIYSWAYLSYGKSNLPLEPLFYPSDHFDDAIEFYKDNITSEYGLVPTEDKFSKPADKRIVVTYGCSYEITSGYPLESWQVNDLIFPMPSTPILQQIKGFKAITNIDNSIIKLESGKTYEFVIFSADGAQQHPWHLHGYTLEFVKVGHIDLSALPTAMMDACGYPMPNTSSVDWNLILDPINKHMPILTIGDSFTVPNGGYVVFRFKADNEGPWMFHCHVNWHMMQGMMTIISVEKNGAYPSIKSPPKDFPICYPTNASINLDPHTKKIAIIVILSSFFSGIVLCLVIMLGLTFIARSKKCNKCTKYKRKPTNDESANRLLSEDELVD
jgi:FtsP/CotA-like multicopper oxidase with cupredoxin domain